MSRTGFGLLSRNWESRLIGYGDPRQWRNGFAGVFLLLDEPKRKFEISVLTNSRSMSGQKLATIGSSIGIRTARPSQFKGSRTGPGSEVFGV